jgi:hypothetical protein
MIDGIPNPANPAQKDVIFLGSTGEEYETCRDLDHANYGIGSLVQLAESFHQQGDDTLYIYGPTSTVSGRAGTPGLAQVLETNSYIMLNQAWPPGVSSNPSVWRTNGFSHGSGCVLQGFALRAGGYQMGYNHFVNRLGLKMPNTLRVIQTSPFPFDQYYFHFGLGYLTHQGTY